MGLANPSEPSDSESINLLPSNLVRKYKRENLRIKVWSLTLTITLFVWICFLVTLGSYLFLSQQIGSLNAGNAQEDIGTQKRKLAIQGVKDINAVSSRLLQIKSLTLSAETVQNEFFEAKPIGIVINSYKIDLDKREVNLTGVSDNRAHLIEFKANLEKNPNVSAVTIPISNFEAEVDIEFSLTFSYATISPKPTISLKK
jgi:hypothetical protein